MASYDLQGRPYFIPFVLSMPLTTSPSISLFLPITTLSRSPPTSSHLPTLRNHHILRRLPLGIRLRPRILNLRNDIHALDHVAEDDVLAVEMRGPGFGGDDEELAAVGVGTGWEESVSRWIGMGRVGWVRLWTYPLF